QNFDSGLRTMTMPQASLPTLSPATGQHTEQAIAQYESIAAGGGWPQVAPSDRMRLGNRHAGVVALRPRLMATGDPDRTAGTSDIFDSYVDAGVRRLQVRNGLTADGIVQDQTFKALNVPATMRLAQLRTNLGRLRTLSAHLSNRFVVCNI